MSLKYYSRLDSLPVYNWEMLHVENNVRWLLHDFDSKLTDTQTIMLQGAYRDLLGQFGILDLPLLKLRARLSARVIELMLEILNTSKDFDKIQKARDILIGIAVSDNPDASWLTVDFTDTSKQKGMKTRIAVEIAKLNEKQEQLEDLPKVDIFEKASILMDALGITIDVKVCSVLQFRAHQKTYQRKLKKIPNGNG